MTEWREHPTYAGYQASDDGRIRSVDRLVRNRWGNEHFRRGRQLATSLSRRGYLSGNLSHDGQRINFEVHVLVAEAWHGTRPANMQVRHLNGNKLNNHPSNLAWGTTSANNSDKVSHGTHHEAVKTHCPAGHEYTQRNTYRAPGTPNKRKCRTCMAIRDGPTPSAKEVTRQWSQDAKSLPATTRQPSASTSTGSPAQG